MRWTDDRLAKIMECRDAGFTMAGTAVVLGVSATALQKVASVKKIRFNGVRRPAPFDEGKNDRKWRKRWETRIGPMKASLRAEIEAMAPRA